MIRILLIFCLSFLLHSDETSILWNEEYKLSWSDFKGQVPENFDAVALTASGITFGYSIKTTDDVIVGINTQIESHFYPEQSWFKRNQVNNIILSHEQLHFDITELHARKFRQELSKIKVSENIKQELDNLHIEINNALYTMQKRYDKETNHSQIIEKQLEWQEMIAEELNQLSKFKNE